MTTKWEESPVKIRVSSNGKDATESLAPFGVCNPTLPVRLYILLNLFVGDRVKKWLFHGHHLDKDVENDLYVQFMANLFSALTTAVLIGGYHVLVHL